MKIFNDHESLLMEFPNFLKAFIICSSVAACSTNIHPQDDTIVASKAPLGAFQTVVVKPLGARSDQELDTAARNAMNKIEADFYKCMGEIFPKMRRDADFTGNYPPSTLVIEPIIEDIEKKTVGGRIVLGPFQGSSAVLMKVTYTDPGRKEVLAEPVFYAKSNAWAGTFTAGANDNLIMQRVTRRACDYTRKNL